jgi:hypothetical protein
MVEKIRVSLWDIFSFFLTGFLAATLVAILLVIYGPLTPKELLDGLSALPAAITIVAAPLALTLLGMIIEPFANYFDRYALKFIFAWMSKPKDKHVKEEELLAEEIRSKYLGSLSGKVSNPYALCKEYVETKQLSTTFMVFLSRYGFYRNCAFLAVVSGVAVLTLDRSWFIGSVSLVVCLAAAAVFKRRAEDFYSYMAPAVYRAFLIDKLQWVPRDGA